MQPLAALRTPLSLNDPAPKKEKEDAEEGDRKYAPDNHVPGHPALDDGFTRIVGIDVAESCRAGRKSASDPFLSSVAGCR